MVFYLFYTTRLFSSSSSCLSLSLTYYSKFWSKRKGENETLHKHHTCWCVEFCFFLYCDLPLVSTINLKLLLNLNFYLNSFNCAKMFGLFLVHSFLSAPLLVFKFSHMHTHKFFTQLTFLLKIIYLY